jgi:4-nitrophenyl phosphatase
MGFRGAVLDVDGTVLRGDRAIPGAIEGIDRFRAADVDRLYVTNNPTHPPSVYVDRLRDAGVEPTTAEVITSGVATAEWLDRHHAGAAVYVIGEDGLREQLQTADVSLVQDFSAAAVVVVSMDRGFDYDRLCEAFWALSNTDVGFVGTDPDLVVPAPERDVPGSGAIINAVAGVVDREPDVVLGKPSEPTRRLVRDRLGAQPEDCLLVGDRLDTDIAMGERAGMTTVLVRTGVTDETTLSASDVQPDHVIDSLAAIDRVLEGG